MSDEQEQLMRQYRAEWLAGAKARLEALAQSDLYLVTALTKKGESVDYLVISDSGYHAKDAVNDNIGGIFEAHAVLVPAGSSLHKLAPVERNRPLRYLIQETEGSHSES